MSNKDKKYDKPVKLEMDFDEAIKRFTMVDKSRVEANIVKKSKPKKGAK